MNIIYIFSFVEYTAYLGKMFHKIFYVIFKKYYTIHEGNNIKKIIVMN